MTGAVAASPLMEGLRRYAAFTIALLAIAASITGLTNGFALDDVHIIVDNERVHSLANAWGIFSQSYWPPEEGGALYRPFTSLAFLLQWNIGGGSPLPFHVASIALYALVSTKVFEFAETIAGWHVAWLAAALFAVHPLHVEVVANAVGQAELWAALLAIPAVTRFVRARREGALTRKDIAVITALYFGALMFKEHVVVLPAILIAAEWLVIPNPGGWRDRVKQIVPLMIAMAGVAIAFIVLRTSVIGSIEGAGVSPIFLDDSFATRFFTMLRVMIEWVRLFFWPAQMAADYTPPRIDVATGFEADMLPGMILLPALTLIAFHVRRSMPAVTLALAWAGITLLIPSNLIVVTGFVLAERTLFLPSVGVMIAAAALCNSAATLFAEEKPSAPKVVGAIVATFLVLGIARSSERNPVWKNNAALITQTIEDSPYSWHAHMMMAQLHSERGQIREAMEETRLAMRLGKRTDHRLLAFAADIFQMGRKCDMASPLYERSLALKPDQPQVRLNAAICLTTLRQFGRARTTALGGGAAASADPRLRRIAQLSDSMLASAGRKGTGSN